VCRATHSGETLFIVQNQARVKNTFFVILGLLILLLVKSLVVSLLTGILTLVPILVLNPPWGGLRELGRRLQVRGGTNNDRLVSKRGDLVSWHVQRRGVSG